MLPGAGRISRSRHPALLTEETTMARTFSRRDVLKASSALALTFPAASVGAAAPAAEAVTPALIDAAKKEGKVVYYTSIDLSLAEKIAKAFEAKYPGIAVRVERTGAERVFQRIGQEYASRIFAVDVANSSDAAHFIAWKREGILQPYMSEDVAKFYPTEHKDPDGLFASFRVGLSVIGYNTNLVKAEDAPKSFADLLDPKWSGKMVKAHPGYSGNVMSATFEVARDIGWEYFEKLAKQKIMQVQSSTDPPKKLALGERSVMVDGNEYNALILKEEGKPIEVVYPTEGTPMAVGPNGIFKNAPNPNAAKLFQSFCFTAECQQLVIDVGALRSVHPQAKEHAGRKRFKDIKVMKDDAAGVEKSAADVKARYSKIFGV
jgi:iron(III) transport system substrate-binding protein